MLRFGMIVLWQYGAVLWSGCFIYGSEKYDVVMWREPLPQSMITLWIRHDERQSNGKPDAAGTFMRCDPFDFGMEHVNRSNLMEVLVAYFLCIRACIKKCLHG